MGFFKSTRLITVGSWNVDKNARLRMSDSLVDDKNFSRCFVVYKNGNVGSKGTFFWALRLFL